LLASPGSQETEEQYKRRKVDLKIEPFSSTRQFTLQYADIYSQRIEVLRPLVSKVAEEKWKGKLSFLFLIFKKLFLFDSINFFFSIDAKYANKALSAIKGERNNI